MAPSKSCGCTDTSPSSTTSTQHEWPSFPTVEKITAQPFLCNAVDLGGVALIITFLHRYVGIDMEYFLWPIFIGLGGATAILGIAAAIEGSRQREEEEMKKEAEKEREKAKRYEMEVEFGLRDKETMLDVERRMLSDKAKRLSDREKALELKEKRLEDEKKTLQAKLEKAKAIATRMKNLDPSDRGLHWLREAEKEAGLEFVRKTMQ